MKDSTGARAALARRRHLLPVGLLLTLVLAYLAGSSFPAQQEVTARILLYPAPSANEPRANPYLALAGLKPAASVLAHTMNAPESARSLLARGASATFDIAQDPLIDGPVLLLDVKGKTAQESLDTLALVLDQAPQTLRQLQRAIDVPEASMISSTLISSDVQPHTVRKDQIRAVLLAVAVGSATTLLAACLLDAVLLRRQQRRGRQGLSAGSKDGARRDEPAQVVHRMGQVTAPEEPGGRFRPSPLPDGRAGTT